MHIVALELKTISGIPLHPLVVHLPVVLIPLAAVGALIALVRPPWRSWALPLTATFAGIGLFGVQLAMQSGEGLEEILNEKDALIEKHSQLAEQARPMVLAFFLVALAAAVVFKLAARKPNLTKLLVPLCALSVLTGALATAWVYRTGHSGAESVWKDAGQPDGGGAKPAGATGDDDGD